VSVIQGPRIEIEANWGCRQQGITICQTEYGLQAYSGSIEHEINKINVVADRRQIKFHGAGHEAESV